MERKVLKFRLSNVTNIYHAGQARPIFNQGIRYGIPKAIEVAKKEIAAESNSATELTIYGSEADSMTNFLAVLAAAQGKPITVYVQDALGKRLKMDITAQVTSK